MQSNHYQYGKRCFTLTTQNVNVNFLISARRLTSTAQSLHYALCSVKVKQQTQSKQKTFAITQDLGYDSQKDYMERKLALRNVSVNGVTEYESKMMKNIHGHCP